MKLLLASNSGFLIERGYALLGIPKDYVRERIASTAYPVRFLRDGQGILVEDDSVTFVGEGEEVKL